MRRLKSEQSRALRRRLTLRTVIALLVYTAAFIALALVANVTLVPRLADEVADATGDAVRYDPMEYLRTKTVRQLLNDYLASLEDEKTPYSILWTLTDDEMEALCEKRLNGEDDPNAGTQAIAAEKNGASVGGDADPDGWVRLGEEAYGVELDQAAAQTPAWLVGMLEQYLSDDQGDYAQTQTVPLTLDMLAFNAAWEDFNDMRSRGGSWDIWSESAEYGPFVARDLSTYNAIKVLKIPAAVLLYLLGCLIIALAQMQRSLRCFDELAGAVAGLMADRASPVVLSKDLSIAQSELNRIRLEALADERAAAAAEQRKNELVAYLAHDIRTPLTSVIGYLSLLDESPDLPPESRQRFTRTAFAKAERLESLIDELFEITRYNLQSIPIERSTVDVQLFLEQIAEEFFPQASEKGVRISVQAPPGQTFFVDAEKLARAVGNVVRNAVAYADAGTHVVVAAQREGTGAHAAPWRITVTDRGREISPEHLESIFEKFYREDGARSAHSGGAGLGLAIAREIITAHDGTITAESRDGTTIFTITL